MQKQDKTILVVDDDGDLRNILEMILSEDGYRVLTANDGRDALEVIRRVFPDLILLDMKMPVMDGWEFARRFRSIYGRTSPIVVNTAAENSEARAKEINAEGHIGKPFELDALLRTVETVLSDSEVERRAERRA